ncbi:MAG: ribosomal protein S18-alanine N-acetyltransferase [Candidatus Bathyarchaeia archaeon]
MSPANLAQIGEVIGVNEICLPEHYSRSFYEDLLRRFPKTFLVALHEGNVIGYVMCRMEFGFSELHKLKLTKKGHVVSIAVLPEHRRRGVGTMLMSQAMAGMREYGASESFLEVRVGNDAAIRFYESLGFRIVHRRAHYYIDGEDASVMVKSLSTWT